GLGRERLCVAGVPDGSGGREHAAGGHEDDLALGTARRLDAGDPPQSRRALRTRAAAAVARTQAATLHAFIQAAANATRAECRVTQRLDFSTLVTRSSGGDTFGGAAAIELSGDLYRRGSRGASSASNRRGNEAKEHRNGAPDDG